MKIIVMKKYKCLSLSAVEEEAKVEKGRRH